MHDDIPALVRRDRARQARFQRLYAIEAAALACWRMWGWWKTMAAVIGWLWSR